MIIINAVGPPSFISVLLIPEGPSDPGRTPPVPVPEFGLKVLGVVEPGGVVDDEPGLVVLVGVFVFVFVFVFVLLVPAALGVAG